MDTSISLETLCTPQKPAPAQPTPSPPVHDHYQSLPPDLSSRFKNLDLDAVFEQDQSALLDHSTQNFVIDFGGAKEDGGQAWCAVNIDGSDKAAVTSLLTKQRPRELRTRWINIYSPHTQIPLVKTIAEYYGMTPRHVSVLTAEAKAEAPPPQPSSPGVRLRDRLMHPLHHDVESAAQHDPAERMNGGGINEGIHTANVMGGGVSRKKYTFMDLVNRVWHWHAVEWGGRFLCIGYNALYALEGANAPNPTQPSDSPKDDDDNEEVLEDTGDNYPEGKRLWMWLVLCDDGTVLTLHEPAGTMRKDELGQIRRNLLTVFRSLSRSKLALDAVERTAMAGGTGGGLEELPFRKKMMAGAAVGYGVESDPSLLFYYLFDDWYSSYTLVYGRGKPYSEYMRQLRNSMMDHPTLTHISRLHKLARQLATLGRMYETKKIIIDNVLYRQEKSFIQKNPPPPPPTTTTSTPPSTHPPSTHLPPMGDPSILGVPLDPLATAKFERLRDRIKIYALGEVNSLLLEKNELVSMTFNLIALLESKSVEKLTRVAILITKFTFLFLPVTLVTGYFSMQLTDVQNVYSQKAFWGATGVCVVVTTVFLWVVGRATGTLETGGIVSGFWRVVGGKAKKRIRRRRKVWGNYE